MSDNAETPHPESTGNVGPNGIGSARTGANYTPGPLENDTTAGTGQDARAGRAGAFDSGNTGRPPEPVTQDGGQGAAGLAAAASDDAAQPGTAAPDDRSGVVGVGSPTGAGGPGAGGATDVTTLEDQ